MITNMFFKLPICKEIQAFKIPISSPITMPSLFFRKRTVINMLSLPLVAQCLFSHEAIATCQNALPYVEKGKENELKWMSMFGCSEAPTSIYVPKAHQMASEIQESHYTGWWSDHLWQMCLNGSQSSVCTRDVFWLNGVIEHLLN